MKKWEETRHSCPGVNPRGLSCIIDPHCVFIPNIFPKHTYPASAIIREAPIQSFYPRFSYFFLEYCGSVFVFPLHTSDITNRHMHDTTLIYLNSNSNAFARSPHIRIKNVLAICRYRTYEILKF